MGDHSKRTGPALEAHYQFLLWLFPSVDRFPKAHKFVFGDRILNTALDVLENLVEATFTRDRKTHLARANLGIDKLRLLLRMAADFRFLDRRRYEHAVRSLDEIGRLIGGWSKIFRGRFTSVAVNSDAHLVQASRYIHRNPVEAGLVVAPWQWPWSSAQAYLGLTRTPTWLHTEAILEMLGPNDARRKYRHLLSEDTDPAAQAVCGEGVPWGQTHWCPAKRRIDSTA
jgi:hypothetical protein